MAGKKTSTFNVLLLFISSTIYFDIFYNFDRVELRDALVKLKAQCGVRSVLVEGGAEIIQSVLRARLCHQIVLTLKPLYFGGYRSMTEQLESPALLTDVSVHQVENDFLMHGTFATDEVID